MAKVIMYTSDVCKFCDKMKDFLKTNKVEFEERNVKQNQEWVKELFQKSGGYGVPVLDIEGTIIVGYNVPKVKAALGLQ